MKARGALVQAGCLAGHAWQNRLPPSASRGQIRRVEWLCLIVLAVVAYLVGSLPTGYVVARAKGIDIRGVGSGNIGATNVFRVVGVPAGVGVLVVDGLKGYAACTWLADLVLGPFGVPLDHALTERVVAGICAVLGHNFTCWLRFKGGKGIATSAGVYFALAPLAAGIALGAWTMVFLLGRYVSLASLVAAGVLPAAVWATQRNVPLGLVTTALGALAIWKHKSNIRRLLAGTESRVVFRKPAPEVAP